jgi:hypothetical protein
MSAFICDPDHIKALAAYAAGNNRSYGRRMRTKYLRKGSAPEGLDDQPPEIIATWIADVLYQENIRSVRARYPDDTWDSLPGLVTRPIHIIVTERDLYSPFYPKCAIDILKMCDCLNYQSCETEDWYDTLAYEILNDIRYIAISELPGYDEAPWEFSLPRKTA